jgi:aryl-alcohol dehydrogenase-like predicted oxidoreductase
VPIPGTKRRKYLEENAAAAAVALTGGEMKLLDGMMGMGKVAGERYSKWVMETVDR